MILAGLPLGIVGSARVGHWAPAGSLEIAPLKHLVRYRLTAVGRRGAEAESVADLSTGDEEAAPLPPKSPEPTFSLALNGVKVTF